METNSDSYNEMQIDYDTIQAPQFVDFQYLSIADDTEDPAPKFFGDGAAAGSVQLELDEFQEQADSIEINVLVEHEEVEVNPVSKMTAEPEPGDGVEASPVDEHKDEVAVPQDLEPNLEIEAPVEPLNVDTNPETDHPAGANDVFEHERTESNLPSGPATTAGVVPIEDSAIPAMIVKNVVGGVTVPKPFNFQNKTKKPAYLTNDKDNGHTFKARPAPMKVLHGAPIGLKPKPDVKITVAVAPHFASDDRIRSRHMRANGEAEVKENLIPRRTRGSVSGSSHANRESRTRSVPSTPVRGNGGRRSPSPAVRTDKTVTVTKPFSFEERERERKRLREEKLRAEEANRLALEHQQLVHKAQPIKGTRSFEVRQSNKPLTHPMSPAFAPLPSQRRNLHQLHNNVQPQ